MRRDAPDGREVYLGHMGGPFWTRKEERAWSIPKGLVEPGEELLAAVGERVGLDAVEELGVGAGQRGGHRPTLVRSQRRGNAWRRAHRIRVDTLAP